MSSGNSKEAWMHSLMFHSDSLLFFVMSMWWNPDVAICSMGWLRCWTDWANINWMVSDTLKIHVSTTTHSCLVVTVKKHQCIHWIFIQTLCSLFHVNVMTFWCCHLVHVMVMVLNRLIEFQHNCFRNVENTRTYNNLLTYSTESKNSINACIEVSFWQIVIVP